MQKAISSAPRASISEGDLKLNLSMGKSDKPSAKDSKDKDKDKEKEKDKGSGSGEIFTLWSPRKFSEGKRPSASPVDPRDR